MLAILEAARNGVRRETRKRTCQGELKGCTNSRHPWRICPQRLFGLKDKAWHFIILCRPYFIFNICRPQTSLVLPDLLKKMKNYKALKMACWVYCNCISKALFLHKTYTVKKFQMRQDCLLCPFTPSGTWNSTWNIFSIQDIFIGWVILIKTQKRHRKGETHGFESTHHQRSHD